MSYRAICVLTFLLALLLAATDLVTAANDWDEEKPARGTVNNYDLFGKKRGKRDSKINYMQTEMATRIDDPNRAIILGRKAVKLDPDDIDARVALGEALYQKIEDQETKDPKLFNECVKTWLMVHRNIVGEEQGLTHKGLAIPGMVKFFEDEDRGIISRERLMSLCGRVPKIFESNQKYLDEVLMPEKTVTGQVMLSSGKEPATEKTKRKHKEDR